MDDRKRVIVKLLRWKDKRSSNLWGSIYTLCTTQGHDTVTRCGV